MVFVSELLTRVPAMIIAPTVGRAWSLPSCAVRFHGIIARRRMHMRVASKTRFQVLGFPARGGGRYGKETLTCWCQSVPGGHENNETDVPEDGASGAPAQVEAFCRLPSTVPWGPGVVASTMVIFWAGFHIPLGLGGLDIVAKNFPQQFMDPQTQAVSVVLVQLVELSGTIWLIQSSLQPFGPLPDCLNFRFTQVWRNRGWLPASATGLLVLLFAVAATATLTQDVSSSEVSNGGSSGLTSLLSNSTPLARVAIFVAYCGLTPCLEEYVYRGFLVSSLRTHMRWPFAVMISAFVFSVSHFSPPGFLSLFWVGCCLGTAYSWTGNLATSFVIHSVYNAVVLTKALLY